MCPRPSAGLVYHYLTLSAVENQIRQFFCQSPAQRQDGWIVFALFAVGQDDGVGIIKSEIIKLIHVYGLAPQVHDGHSLSVLHHGDHGGLVFNPFDFRAEVIAL